ncbi:hypothetical protein CgunFtcFv8_016631 [Champsocephalus gunnari]|uniref:Uncharacterized protein n=1 Tax=Champsocephalus gunnari TaxID=52237 RepID=A0AAN8HAM5_CHAGU|nr:hypothetical protein CgunFtcFv8_016631 [Champsocephalus gunnari]
MLLRLWRIIPLEPLGPDVFDTTSHCALSVSAAVPVRRHQLPCCPGGGVVVVRALSGERRPGTRTGKLQIAEGQSISEHLLVPSNSKSCTITRGLHITSMLSHNVT